MHALQQKLIGRKLCIYYWSKSQDRTTETQRDWGWKLSLGMASMNSCLDTELVAMDFIELGFWISPSKETVQVLWAIWATTGSPSQNKLTNKQKSWIIFKWNLLFFNLCPFPLVLLVGSTEYGSIFFTLPSRYSFRYSADIHQSPAFFSSGRTVPAFSPSTQLQSLEHFCSPSLYLFHYVPVCLILRSPEMDPALQISLTSLEQRGSFSLTASVALPNAPRRLFAFLSAKAHSLIRFNTLSIRITRTNFAELFLSYFASAWVMSLHVQDFSLLNFIKLVKLTLRRGSLAKQLFAMHRKYDSIYFLWYILVANKMIANLRAIFWWF